MEKALVNKKYVLEKYPGKGGWTFARIPEISQDKKAHFGWVKVRGSIDGVEIKKYNLMPMGDGKLFLPVKLEIRKKIKKEAGDTVHVILYPDNEPTELPEELLTCLKAEPDALKFFNSLGDGEKQSYIKWIYLAKTDDTKVNRIANTIGKLLKAERFAKQSLRT